MTDKNSFVLYTDALQTVEKLTDEQAGKLFKIILEYVNDKNPTVEDLLLQIAFEPIKSHLKRDLKKWQLLKEKRSEAGKKGGLKSGETRAKTTVKKQVQPNEANASFDEANEAVSVSANVTVNGDTTVSSLSEREFISLWAKARMTYDKKITGFENLLPFERQNFNQLANKYSKQEFVYAIAGLFFQDTVPHVRTRPGHFLKPENFTTYLDNWQNQTKMFDKGNKVETKEKFHKGDI